MKVLLDLDGVLVDFIKGCCELHGRNDPYQDKENHGKFDLEKLFGIDSHQFWNGMEHDFWYNLQPMHDAFEIVEAIESVVSQKDICILSSPSMNPGSMSGKIAWVERNLPAYRRSFLFGPKKEFCANPSHVLIDDYDKNTCRFSTAGGKTILVPRPWNSLHLNHRDNIPEHIKGRLCSVKYMLAANL